MAAKDEAMDTLKREVVDLENIPVADVFENLRCTKEGLSSEDAARRLEIFGQNKLEEKNESKFLKFLGFMLNPLSWVMEAASIMAIALANGGGTPSSFAQTSDYNLGEEGDLFKAPETVIQEPFMCLDPISAAISMISCGEDVILPQSLTVSDIESSIKSGQLLSEYK